ncbi:fibrobacter succinogenes major paralogous domain-containing protein [Pedobacter caeni]|uniref:Fibronectin type-III domain-containing protein n=1 Tax=Pedobacter caeni TaxID=288992 RepID=A0A1M5LJ82_9SPHI|nr:hypothetical protein [Pedobacter caeni]SHG65101.1 hypothetical protein SAMN04488522_106366 [Pedobacter caeni]
MKSLLYSAFLCLLFIGNSVSGQRYFSVLNGVPQLAVLDHTTISNPKTGMLIYSTVAGKPLIYTGISWENLCTNTSGTVSAEDYFMVKEGISYLPVLGSHPEQSKQAGTLYYSSTNKSTMIYDGSGWVKIKDLQKSNFSENKGFTAGKDAKAFKLPVLNSDPSGANKGAFYISSLSGLIRYYDGAVWQDLRCGAEVLTLAVTDIKGSTAIGNGNVISNGGSGITMVGLCWSTNANPDISLSTKTGTAPTGDGLGAFTGILKDLMPNTIYHVRAYATNTEGTVYGEDLIFKTVFDLPTIITLPISDITSITALSGGDITDDGGSPVSARGIRWSVKGDPLLDKDAVITNDGDGVGLFPSSVVGLLGNTTYYVRAYAVNSQGTAYGNLLQFTTLPAVPPVLSSATVSVTDVTNNSAKGRVNILNNGGAIVTARGFAWSTDRSNWIHGTSATVNPTDVGVFIGNLTDLFPGTTYYAKGYATNSAGTSYTSETSFTTNSLARMTTAKVTNVTGISAIGGGQIIHNGGSLISVRGICWSTAENPTMDLPTKTEQVISGDGIGHFGLVLKDLVPGTTYYVRAYAVNDVGISYGNQEVFSTAGYPQVRTLSAGSFFNNTAKAGGQVLRDGGATVTSRGICWGTEANPSIGNGAVSSNGSGMGIYTTTLSGLLPDVVYHMRAYATNVVGTVYGEDVTFSLIPGLPSVSTQAITAITNMTATGGGIVSSNGIADITSRGIHWSITGDPADDPSAGMTNDGPGTGNFQSFMKNLLGNTTYYVRAYATNRFGTAYGDLIEFNTRAPQPPVLASSSLSIYNITDTKATGDVSMLNNGGAKILSKGIAYSIDRISYLNAESATINPADIGNFRTELTGLIPGTVYCAKGYATNSEGTAFTVETSFITPLNISLTTKPVTLVTSSTAESGGIILNTGSSGVTHRGICWSTSPNPTTSDFISSSGTSAENFTVRMTGLSGSTKYYVRAYAGNNSVTTYGNTESFITAPPGLATVSTLSVDQIGGVTASASGEISDEGGSPVNARGICWNTSPDPTITNGAKESGSGKGLFSAPLTGLTPLTKYYVRAYAVNEVGVVYGNELIFTTATTATLTTLPATAITANTASSGGNITSDGGTAVTASGICWSTAGLPTIEDPHTSSGPGIGNFIHSLKDLFGSTTYYIRAYAINSAGVVYGQVESFTTAPPVLAKLITTAPYSGAKGVTGISGGSIQHNGGAVITDRGLVWSTNSGFDPEAASTRKITEQGSGSFAMTMPDLLPGTTYYVRAFATNSVGISYANEERFNTFNLPLVSTSPIQPATITSTEAIAGGNISDNGGTEVTSNGLCWSTSTNPVLTDEHTSNATGMGSFANRIGELLGSTRYYVRAYATNAVGTAYGEVESFTTLPPVLATLITTDAEATSTTTAKSGGTILTHGGAVVTTRGVYWSTQPDFNPDTITLNKTAETGYFTGSFTAQLKGLTQHTTYYVRAYVVNSVGIAYGNTVSFITPQLPTLTTAFSKATGSTSGLSGGDISDEGGSNVYSRGVVWSLDRNFNPDTVTINRTTNGNRGGAFASILKNLKANSTYYVQAYARNVAGTSYGNLLNFITDPPVLATLTTRGISGLGGTTAWSGGDISDNGGDVVSTRGLVWSTQPGFRPDTLVGNKTIISGSGNGGFNSNMTGLLPGTTYYVRAYAINTVGVAYGNEQHFTTLIIPSLTTNPVAVSSSGITATGGGTLLSNGGTTITNQGLVWSTRPNPALGSPQQTANDSWTGNTFRSVLTRLEPVTLYYVRAYAQNSQGTAYGNEQTFTTPAILPSLTTTYITPSSKSSATTGGNISKDGGAAITARGVVWSLDRNFNPEAETLKRTSNGTGTGIFTSEVTNLNLSMAYYVRAYATNSVGTAYGNQVTVTLFPTAPILTTTEVTDLTGYAAKSGGIITSDGGADITLKGLCWSTRTNPTIKDSRTNLGVGLDPFTGSMTGLAPNTLYYVRAYAQNKIGVAYGVEHSFLTNAFPTLTVTATVTNILATTATSGGDITDDGRTAILSRGITWNTTGNPTIALGTKTIDNTTTGIGQFVANLKGLADKTTYYVRAYATNAVGTTYGSEVAFTTLEVMLPTIFTSPVKELTANSVLAGGDITDDGGMPVTNRGICWSLNPNPVIVAGSYLNHATAGTGNFQIPITGLLPGTRYYVRAYAINSKGTAFGAEQSFVTLAIPPAVTMVTLSNPTMTGTDGSASVTKNGGDEVTDRGFYWSKFSKTPVFPLAADSVISVGTTAPFTMSINNLTQGTRYYFWAYATNAAGTGFSPAPASLTTPTLPTVTTNKPTGILSNSAVSGGFVGSDGGLPVTARGLCWSTETNPTTAVPTKSVDGAGLSGFVTNIKGLANGTKYYIRAYATNSLGTSYGNLDSLTTLDLPTLTTTPATSILTSSAVTGGEITSDGGTTVYARGICWSTVKDPTILLTTKTSNGQGTGVFTSNMTGLVIATKYYFRAYATNSVGTAYGALDSLNTPAIPPTVGNVKISNMTDVAADGSAEVTSDGKAEITERGLVWSTKNPVPTINDQKVKDATAGLGIFTLSMKDLIEGPTYYVRAYATNSAGTGYSPEVMSFKICLPFNIIHKAGLNGAPVDKTITYKTVATNISGAARCWIAQNLGADQQAVSVSDASPAAAGWYFQFNRAQGYEFTDARNPATNAWTPWKTDISENSDWAAATDPCNLLLGGGWRIPTGTEWTAADGAPQNWNKDVDAYNSELKLHNAGYLSQGAGLLLDTRGKAGSYWARNQYTSSNYTFGMTFMMGPNTSSVINGATGNSYKALGMPLRCIRDTVVLTKAIVSNVNVPVSEMKVSSAEGLATVVSDGGTTVTARGLVWSTTNTTPTLADGVIAAGQGVGNFKSTLSSLSEGPTYYVRAYATNKGGTAYSTEVSSFKICNPFTVVHVAGLNGAPVSKTVTYGTVSSNISGAARCWITQNLGADGQAKNGTDKGNDVSGWYWQFNQVQGYQHDGTTRTPSNAWTPWISQISEYLGWLPAKDPCMLLLGSGWRLPTIAEWAAAEAPPQNWETPADTYNSALKIHAAGYISNSSVTAPLAGRGTQGYYWSSTMGPSPTIAKGLYNNMSVTVGDLDKASALAVRCIRDEITETLPSVSNVEVPVSGMTAATASGTAGVGIEGSAPVTERGLVWSDTETVPTIADHKVMDNGKGMGTFTGILNGLIEGPTYYVRAYAVSAVGTVYSPQVSSFKICNSFTMIHKAGLNGAPVDKTVTYKTVSTSISGAPRCWITQNLGAEQEAISVADASPAAAGWYFQFNRAQGYEFKEARVPAANAWTPWKVEIAENIDWTAANDPCNLLLGGGWRIPTATEWTTADAAPQFWAKDAEAYNSVLKLHNAGYLSQATGLLADTRGKAGTYWTSNQYPGSGYSFGTTFLMGATASSVVTGPTGNTYKALAMPLRCIRDAVVLTKPILNNASIPVPAMKETTAEVLATVVSDGGSTVTARGLVWSTSNLVPTLDDHVLTNGLDTGSFKITMTGLEEGPTYYVRAYATNKGGTAYSAEVSSFKICNPFTVVHKAGLNGAAVSKTVTYTTVSSNISGAARCWIAQNLGADRQATSATDASTEAAGWNWQFNQVQGYQHDGTTRTPSNAWTSWIMQINESIGWLPAKDPCMLLLGSGWRLPTAAEWTMADAPPQNWMTQADTYNSALKLHGSGYIGNTTAAAPLIGRGVSGYYWSSTMGPHPTQGKGLFNNGSVTVGDLDKSFAQAIRCIRDEIIETLPSVSNVEVPVSGMTATTASGTVTVAPEGTAPVTERGLVWSSTEKIPTIADNKVMDKGKGMGEFTGVLNGLTEGPTYYVRAYAISAVGTVYSPQVSSFKICNPFTMIHKAGLNGAPVDKTITYKTVSSSISGAPRCWITQNLGAEQEATSVSDNSAAAAGWYFQFNRAQGYEFKEARVPAANAWTPWKVEITENIDWTAANDPCNLLLGGGWRIPTATEWTTTDAAPQFWAKDADAYNSVLKLHNAGYLSQATGLLADTRGKTGTYWTSNQFAGSGYSFGTTFLMGAAASSVVTGPTGNTYKALAMPLRCIRDAVVLTKPILNNASIPVPAMKETTAEVLATVASGGGSTVTARGLVWSTGNSVPTLDDHVLSNGLDTGSFKITMTGLEEGPTYYVRAYATNSSGTAYSPEVSSFKICNPFTVIHKAGLNGAPVSKTVTYTTVSSNISGAARCWIAQNLGADRQATSATDASTEAAGWNWQFNQVQGYQHDGTTRTPSNAWTSWIMQINESIGWLPAKDPCMLLLGSGWRLPTAAEWTMADAPPQNWMTQTDTYNSALKLHGSGYIGNTTAAAPLIGRGVSGYYWSSTMGPHPTQGKGLFNNGSVTVGDLDKAFAQAVRCIRDEIIETLPSVSNVEVPVSGMTATSAAGTATVAPAGTAPVTERGLVWSSTETIPTIAHNKVMDSGKGVGEFTGTLAGLTEGPTYYVRAYAISAVGTVYSQQVSSFKICNPFTIVHKAGVNGAPVDKTVTYKTVSSSISGAPRCWITQNLGAEQQAISASDNSVAAAGWYFQFNRAQGYEFAASRIPSTPAWKVDIPENQDWIVANDPCNLLLGSGWRIPTATEWTTADAAPQFWAKDADAYNSVLKLHNAGYLAQTNGLLADTRGKAGSYWTSNQFPGSGYSFGTTFLMGPAASSVITGATGNTYKALGMPLRCLKN